MAVGQNWVPEMGPWYMEPRTKTCGPVPGGGLILTHTQMITDVTVWACFPPAIPLVQCSQVSPSVVW